MAKHFENLDHNSIYRYLKTEKLTPRLLWEKLRDTIVYSPRGAIIFDDTVLDKSYSFAIEGVRRQYSSNEHAVIKGIGLVTCVYYNPELDRFWVLDYRLFDPDQRRQNQTRPRFRRCSTNLLAGNYLAVLIP